MRIHAEINSRYQLLNKSIEEVDIKIENQNKIVSNFKSHVQILEEKIYGRNDAHNATQNMRAISAGGPHGWRSHVAEGWGWITPLMPGSIRNTDCAAKPIVSAIVILSRGRPPSAMRRPEIM